MDLLLEAALQIIIEPQASMELEMCKGNLAEFRHSTTQKLKTKTKR